MKQRRKFSAEYKREAVAMLESSGVSASQTKKEGHSTFSSSAWSMPMCGCLPNTLFLLSLQYQRGDLACSQSARVQRGESATARCASTGNYLAILAYFS